MFAFHKAKHKYKSISNESWFQSFANIGSNQEVETRKRFKQEEGEPNIYQHNWNYSWKELELLLSLLLSHQITILGN